MNRGSLRRIIREAAAEAHRQALPGAGPHCTKCGKFLMLGGVHIWHRITRLLVANVCLECSQAHFTELYELQWTGIKPEQRQQMEAAEKAARDRDREAAQQHELTQADVGGEREGS